MFAEQVTNVDQITISKMDRQVRRGELTHVLLNEIESIVRLLRLLVQTHQTLGQGVEDAGLLQVLSELLFLAIGWLVRRHSLRLISL